MAVKVARTIGCLLVLSCGCRAEDAISTHSSAIVGGVDSPHARDAVVQLATPAGHCSATLVAPNLLLTALHCVALPKGTNAQCDETGAPITPAGAPWPDGDKFGADRDPHTLAVLSGGQGPTPPLAVGSSDPSLARGVQIFHSPDPHQCKTDLALVLLDRGVDDPVIAPLRLDAGVSAGEHLLAVGWGWTSGTDLASTRQEREVLALAIGPAPSGFPGDVALPPGFFSFGESACSGDSGGPAIADSGAVVGVASTLEKPNLLTIGSADDCKGSTVRVHEEATLTDRDVILAAFQAAGQAPWIEGTPDPRASLAGFEAPCATDGDCRSNACVADASGMRRCTVGCAGQLCTTPGHCPPSTCPDGYACGLVDGHHRCQTALGSGGAGGGAGGRGNGTDDGGSCSFEGSAPPNTTAAVACALLLAAACARRRSTWRPNPR